MANNITILKRTKQAIICGLILQLCACTTIPKKSLSEQIADVKTLVEKVKNFHNSPDIVGEKLQQAEKNLLHAEESAKKGANDKAQQFTEKAQSDAEYAKATVYAVIYQNLMQKREKSLKVYQEALKERSSYK